jgi:large subunit ribosomal protein L1
MAQRGKKYRASIKVVDRTKRYLLEEAIAKVKEVKYAKFDETVDLAVNLGVNPKHADQMVRGACALPHGIGKSVRVLVFAKGEKEKEARDAGADYVGNEEIIEKIKGGWMEFDKAIATPDMMGQVGKIGKILGPRGLMPNPKVGTVTFDIAKAVQDLKAGKIDFRVEKAGIVHAPVGKASFDVNKLKDNIVALMEVLMKLKPASSKGTYLKSITLSTTMSPGIHIDPVELQAGLK